MFEHDYPILEFDKSRDVFISPKDFKNSDLGERCVLCFFREAIKSILKKYNHKIVDRLNSESDVTPIYELQYGKEKILLVQAIVGSPMAAAQIEELSSRGCKKFICVGSCGVIQHDLAVGHLIIPTSAVRDEGTSYHYAPPSQEIKANRYAVKCIEQLLKREEIPFIKAKTWTTDAFFRETKAKVAKRKSEGCVTVEMEASTYMAVAKYTKTLFSQILYAGDSLCGEIWDSRHFNKQKELREFLLNLAIKTCLDL